MAVQQGKKMAVVVGCNYSGGLVLLGCHTDALSMRELLIARFGFVDKDVEVLIDKPDSPTMPTGANIKQALNRMVDMAKQGDVLFFHFSGHGTLIEPPQLPKEEEAILPSDYNLITSVDFREIVNRVPQGATFTILADSCFSGGLIDQEKEQIGPDVGGGPGPAAHSGTPRMIPFKTVLLEYLKTDQEEGDIGRLMVERFGEDASLVFRNNVDVAVVGPGVKADEGILLSGCQQEESSYDIRIAIPPHGAFSNAVQIVAREEGLETQVLSNRDIVKRARMVIQGSSTRASTAAMTMPVLLSWAAKANHLISLHLN